MYIPVERPHADIHSHIIYIEATGSFAFLSIHFMYTVQCSMFISCTVRNVPFMYSAQCSFRT